MGTVIEPNLRQWRREVATVRVRPKSPTWADILGRVLLTGLIIGVIMAIAAFVIAMLALFAIGFVVGVQWFFDVGLGWVPCVLLVVFFLAVITRTSTPVSRATTTGLEFPIERRFTPRIAYSRGDESPDDHRPAA